MGGGARGRVHCTRPLPRPGPTSGGRRRPRPNVRWGSVAGHDDADGPRLRHPRPPLLRRPVGRLPLVAHQRPGALGRAQRPVGGVEARGRRARLAPHRAVLARPRACAPVLDVPLSIIAMDDPEHTAAASPHQPGLHPRPGARAHRPHAGAHRRAHRRHRRPGRDRLRRGLRHPPAAHHHRRAHGPRPRAARAALPVVRRHDERRGPHRGRRPRPHRRGHRLRRVLGAVPELIAERRGKPVTEDLISHPHQRPRRGRARHRGERRGRRRARPTSRAP